MRLVSPAFRRASYHPGTCSGRASPFSTSRTLPARCDPVTLIRSLPEDGNIRHSFGVQINRVFAPFTYPATANALRGMNRAFSRMVSKHSSTGNCSTLEPSSAGFLVVPVIVSPSARATTTASLEERGPVIIIVVVRHVMWFGPVAATSHMLMHIFRLFPASQADMFCHFGHPLEQFRISLPTLFSHCPYPFLLRLRSFRLKPLVA